MHTSRLLAVGVIRHRPGAGHLARRKARIAVATHADTNGYAVTEMYETYAPVSDAIISHLIRTATQMNAHAVLTLGSIASDILEPIAEHTELTILTVPHPTPSAVGASDDPAAAWTGRLDFDLKAHNKSTAIVIETDIRPRTLIFTLASNDSTLAIISRDTFRQWLNDPGDDLHTDQLTWSRSTGGVCLSIDGTSYSLGAATNSQLRAVV